MRMALLSRAPDPCDTRPARAHADPSLAHGFGSSRRADDERGGGLGFTRSEGPQPSQARRRCCCWILCAVRACLLTYPAAAAPPGTRGGPTASACSRETPRLPPSHISVSELIAIFVFCSVCLVFTLLCSKYPSLATSPLCRADHHTYCFPRNNYSCEISRRYAEQTL